MYFVSVAFLIPISSLSATSGPRFDSLNCSDGKKKFLVISNWKSFSYTASTIVGTRGAMIEADSLRICLSESLSY